MDGVRQMRSGNNLDRILQGMRNLGQKCKDVGLILCVTVFTQRQDHWIKNEGWATIFEPFSLIPFVNKPLIVHCSSYFDRKHEVSGSENRQFITHRTF